MDPPSPSSNGNGNGCGGGVSVIPKYSTLNNFLWYFFQTLTVSSILLMVLSIYYAFASSANIQIVCVITIAFGIITPSFIIPKLPQIAVLAIPIFWLNTTFFIQLLNISVWTYCGYVYPFPVHLSCYSLMAVVGLLKLYYSNGRPNLLKSIGLMGENAILPCVFVFNHEIRYGTGRWMDSGAGWALLGLIVVTMLAYCLPPLVEPVEKEKMMNIIELTAISIEVASEKEKMMMNATEETTTTESGTQTFETVL